MCKNCICALCGQQTTPGRTEVAGKWVLLCAHCLAATLECYATGNKDAVTARVNLHRTEANASG